MKIYTRNISKEKLKNKYDNYEKSLLNSMNRIGKNRLGKNKKIAEDKAVTLLPGSEVYAITRHGLIRDVVNCIDKKYGSLHIICNTYTFFACDFGYTVFTNKEELLKRVNYLYGVINRWRLKHHEFDWRRPQKLIDKLQKSFDGYVEYSQELDEQFPINGYYWAVDPNDMVVTLEKEYDSANVDKSLARQRNCVEGKHMMVKLADGIFWCQNCGTIIKGNYKGEISTRHKYNTNDLEDVLYMYPLAPHFLPKD